MTGSCVTVTPSTWLARAAVPIASVTLRCIVALSDSWPTRMDTWRSTLPPETTTTLTCSGRTPAMAAMAATRAVVLA